MPDSSTCKEGCTEENDIYGTYVWPKTKPGEKAEMYCFYDNVNKAYKSCHQESGKLKETDFENCKSKVTEKILLILEEAENMKSVSDQRGVSEKIKDLAKNYSASFNADDVNDVAKIVDLIIDFKVRDGKLEELVKTNVIKTFDSLHSSTSFKEMADKHAATNVRQAMGNYRNRILAEFNGTEFSYMTEHSLAVAVVPFKEENLSFSVFGDKNNLTASQMQSINLEDINSEAMFSAKVPSLNNKTFTAVFHNSDKFYPENDTVRDASIAVATKFYNEGQLRRSVNKVVSMIADIKYEDTANSIHFKDGRTIEMIFSVEDIQPPLPKRMALKSKYECVFYNTKTKVWVTGKESGCITSVIEESNRKRRVNCKCSHMTSFAVLMSFYSDYSPLEGTVTSILLGTSLVCLILTIVAYLPAKEMLKSRPVRINLLLVTSLIFSVISFFSMEHLTSVKMDYSDHHGDDMPLASSSCTFVAFLMNYFWLCQMAWMVCEAVVMYQTLVSHVLNSYISCYMIKFNLACWGIPLIFPIIGITVGRSNFAHPDTCFLRKQYGLVAFYIPVIMCVLLNTTLFLRLSRFIMVKGEPETEDLQIRRKQKRKKQLKCAVTLMTLFGISWIFGIFLIIDEINNMWLRWLFIICNSTQGTFIFGLYVLLNKDLMERWKEWVQIFVSRFGAAVQVKLETFRERYGM